MAKEKTKPTIDLDEILKGIRKEFGDNSVIKMSDSQIVKCEAISTGSFSLDMALGVGGFPKGRVVEIYGPESGGKTTLALSTIAQAQKAGGLAALIDIECTFDSVYAEKIGVDVKNLIIHTPNIEKGNNAEESLNIAARLMESGAFSIIVIDSVAALVPKAQAEGDIEIAQMGIHARLMGAAMKKLAPLASRTNTLLLFTNQVRLKIGIMFGNPETTPGGKALPFYASQRVDIRKVTTVKEGDESVGIQVRAKVMKNKVAPPFRQAEFYLMFEEGISRAADVFNIGVTRNVIEKKGNTYYYNDEKLGVGMKSAIAELKKNTPLAEKIEEKIKSMNGAVTELKRIDEEETLQ